MIVICRRTLSPPISPPFDPPIDTANKQSMSSNETKCNMAESENKNRVLFTLPNDEKEMNCCSAQNSDLGASDASSSSMKSSDGYLPTNEPTSSSSDSDIVFSSDEDVSSEDVEETIDFIRQKQGILKRASSVLFDHEETYDAATAKATSRMVETESRQNSIWMQAKRVIPQKKVPPRRLNLRRNASGPKRGGKKPLQPNPRDPTINLGKVGHVASSNFEESELSEGGDNDTTDGLPEVAFPQGQWMAQALIRSSSTDDNVVPECRSRCHPRKRLDDL